MSDLDRFEARVRSATASFAYPPTPNVAVSVKGRLRRDVPLERLRARRLAWSALIVIAALASLLAVPQARAGLLEVLEIGAVRLFFAPPTATATPTGMPVITPQPTPTLLPSLLDLAGETTLDEARQKMSFTILLPAYPENLGLPDRVFVQNLGGSVAVMVWLDPEQPDRVRMSFHEFGPNTYADKKFQPTIIAATMVNGQPAVWTEGPYLLELKSGNWDLRRLIEGHVLIWVEAEVTYRLETDLPLDEAVKIAESLK
ncbi:MAG: hypothetical protein HYZ49_07200 [Chloroflexi bacterium]|nr:hypothetical protein [Chloroflexota bacterium]